MCACHVSRAERDVIIWSHRWRRSTSTRVTHGNVLKPSLLIASFSVYFGDFSKSNRLQRSGKSSLDHVHRTRSVNLHLFRHQSLYSESWPSSSLILPCFYTISLQRLSTYRQRFSYLPWPPLTFSFSVYMFFRFYISVCIHNPSPCFYILFTSKPSRSVFSNFVHYRNWARPFVSLSTH